MRMHWLGLAGVMKLCLLQALTPAVSLRPGALPAPTNREPALTHGSCPRPFAACYAFEQDQGCPPTAADAAALAAGFGACGSDAWAAGARQQLDAWLGSSNEFAPVCAIVGGVAANNVVKIVSQSDAPLNNLLYFTLFDGRGVVEARGQGVGQVSAKPAAVIDSVDLLDSD